MSTDVKLSVPSVVVVAAIVGAAAFAIGRATTSSGSSHAVEGPASEPTTHSAPAGDMGGALPPGHPSTEGDLPSGHPPIGNGMPPPGATPMAAGDAGAAEAQLVWKVPAKWQSYPSTSSMRLATYRVPHLPGDDEDPEMSVMQAGGSVDANVQRWIGQFDAEGQKTAKRTTKKVSGLEVTILEVEGIYAGGMGMGKDRGEEKNWALLGAIVATPGMPHFFKLTGPAKTVKAARPDFDALVASFATK